MPRYSNKTTLKKPHDGRKRKNTQDKPQTSANPYDKTKNRATAATKH